MQSRCEKYKPVISGDTPTTAVTSSTGLAAHNTSPVSLKKNKPAENRSSLRRFRWMLLRHGDKISAIVLGILIFFVLLESLSLTLGTLGAPGPGLWPTAIAAISVAGYTVLALIGKDVPILSKAKTSRRFWLYFAAVVLFAPIYSIIGFIPSAFVIVLTLTRWGGGSSWASSIAVSIISPIAIYYLFGVGLNVPISAF